MPSSLHGVILAGGISSRMGSPKALMPLEGSFFLHHVYAALCEAGVKPVHIVVNLGLLNALDAHLDMFREAKFVANTEPARGQIYSLQMGLTAARDGGAPGAMVALVDQPAVKVESMKALRTAFIASGGTKIVLPRVGGKAGHPYIIPQMLFPQFIDASAETTARDLMHEHEGEIIYCDLDDHGLLEDFDTPEDMAKLGIK